MNVESLYAQPGDDIQEKWNLLVDFIKETRPVIGPNIRATFSPTGTHVQSKADIKVTWPFTVGLGAGQVTIGFGLIENQVPFIGELTLEGKDAKGNVSPNGPPVLVLDPGNKGRDERSFVGIRVRPDSGQIPDALKDPQSLQIVHIPDRGALKEGEEFQALAIVYWSGKEPSRMVQVTRHNLAWTYYGAVGERKAFSVFSAV